MSKHVESLDSFICDEIERIKNFRVWYKKQHYINPEQYPLDIPTENTGVWDVMLANFDLPSN